MAIDLTEVKKNQHNAELAMAALIKALEELEARVADLEAV